MVTRTLSRLDFIDIDTNTTIPLVVLEEISNCHNIPLIPNNVNEFLRQVTSNPIGIVNDPPTAENFSIITRYVNPNPQWTINELITAYDYLLSWLDGRLRVPSNFTFGPQIPSDPTRLNACVLYKLCTSYNIVLNYNCTVYQMATLCRLANNDLNYARTVLYNTINYIPRSGLIELYIAATDLMDDDLPQPTTQVSNYDSLVEATEILTDEEQLRLNIQPRTYADAIVLAALNFNIDLSNAQNPIQEYQILLRDPTNYCPLDPNLRQMVTINPYSIQLAETFNPRLPADLYQTAALDRLARIEGYSNTDIRRESSYTLLQTAYMSYTFYHGRQPGMNNTCSPFFYEELDELENDLVVCFGIQGEQGSMTGFYYPELGQLFNFRHNFVNPIDNTQFPAEAIQKLKNLCRLVHQNDTPEIIAARNAVYDAIINTELLSDSNQAQARQFYELYKQADEVKQEQIRTAINKLFILSMYMRGWLGEGAYPIEHAPVDDQALVDVNVTLGLNDFEDACHALGDVGELILNLPLINYVAGNFQPSTTSIKQRLEIVRTGSLSTVEACIRISSNFLAISAYRYMKVLGIDPPFRVEKLRSIQ